MTEEFQPLLDLLSARHGWVSAMITWVGVLRIPIKLVSAQALRGFDRAVASVRGTSDEAWVDRLLHARWYRVLAFVSDWLLSIKLPRCTNTGSHPE
ncbi:MAG: hypothetical protein ACYDC1_06300 [Limisphaerales bacterium]